MINLDLTIRSREDDMKSERRGKRTSSRIPWIVAILLGMFWSTTYLFIGQLHGMWPMYNGEFPFLIARLFTSQVAKLSVAAAAISTFTDGALVGLVGSWLLMLPITVSRRNHNRKEA